MRERGVDVDLFFAQTSGVPLALPALARKEFPGMKPDVIQSALERMDKLFSRDGKFTRANIERTQQISKELGIIKASYAYEDVVAPIARE